jgi:hypothetical protein
MRLAVRGMLPKTKLRDRIMAQRLVLCEVKRLAFRFSRHHLSHLTTLVHLLRWCRGTEIQLIKRDANASFQAHVL